LCHDCIVTEGRRIEVARGREVDAVTAAAVTEFWGRNRVTPIEGVEARLASIVCLLRDEDGSVAGTNSVGAKAIERVSGRVFWSYRTMLDSDAVGHWFMPMLGRCFEVLAAEREQTGEGPVGVFAPVLSPTLAARHREFVWPENGFMFAGWLPGGGQARLRYFTDARI
jgi:hypothetical protein